MALEIVPNPQTEDEPRGPHIVIVEPTDDIAAICGKMDIGPSDQVILVARGRNRALRSELGLPRIKRHAELTGKELALVTRNRELRSRARQLHLPVFNSVKGVWFGRRPSWIIAIGAYSWAIPRPSLQGLIRPVGMFSLLLGLVILAYLFIPSATVTVQPQTETVVRIIPVMGSPSMLQVSVPDLAVPGRPTRVVVPLEIIAPASGSDQVVGDKRAAGEVQFTNKTNSVQTVPAGTIVSTDDGRQFQTLVEVRLPDQGEAKTSVPVQAVNPGEGGNISAQAIKHVEGLGDVVAVTNERGFNGGSNRTVKTVTERDIASARAAARRLGHDLGLRRLSEESKGQSVAVPESVELALTDERLNAKAGDPADYLSYNATAVMNVLVLDRNDLRKLAQAVLQPPGSERLILESSLDVRPLVVRGYNALDQKVDIDVLAMAVVAPPLDLERLKEAISGRSKRDTEAYLRNYGGFQRVTVETKPSWLGLPRLTRRITIQVQP